MKIAFLLVVLVVVEVFAHAQRCPKDPRNKSCSAPRDLGRKCRAGAGTRWYFNRRSKRCESMEYGGCKGNDNRYCSLQECERRCKREPNKWLVGV